MHSPGDDADYNVARLPMILHDRLHVNSQLAPQAGHVIPRL